MSDERVDRLMDAVLDGTATPAEAARLEAHLAAHPEDRERYARLESVFRLLTEMRMAEVPAGVRAGVRAGLAPPAAEGWWTTLATGLRRRPALGHGFAFGVGAIAGVLAFALLTQSTGPGELKLQPVAGTLTPAVSGPGPEATLVVGASRVHLTSRPAAGGVQLEVDARSAEPLEVVVEFDPGVLKPAALWMSRPAGPVARVEPDRWVLESMRDVRVVLEFSGGTAPPSLNVLVRAREGSAQAVLGDGYTR